MRLFIILLSLSINVLGQNTESKKDTINKIEIMSFNNFIKKSSLYKLDVNDNEKKIKYTPHNRKIDISNPNYPKYDYDISNPNKSIDLIGFFLSGLTNLF